MLFIYFLLTTAILTTKVSRGGSRVMVFGAGGGGRSQRSWQSLSDPPAPYWINPVRRLWVVHRSTRALQWATRKREKKNAENGNQRGRGKVVTVKGCGTALQWCPPLDLPPKSGASPLHPHGKLVHAVNILLNFELSLRRLLECHK